MDFSNGVMTMEVVPQISHLQQTGEVATQEEGVMEAEAVMQEEGAVLEDEAEEGVLGVQRLQDKREGNVANVERKVRFCRLNVRCASLPGDLGKSLTF